VKITAYNNENKIMKNILLFTVVLICFTCKAQQQIIPLETKGWPVEGTYYKDLNDELLPYIGTWKGTFDNKTFIITFTKYKDYNSMGNYYKDRLIGKYKMLDNNGAQLYSTYSLTDDEAKVSSLGFVPNTSRSKLLLLFKDLCRDGQMNIYFENAQKTQIHWRYFVNQTLITDDTGCSPNNEMPKGDFTLTKQ
jgi:hypothetical protein